MSLTPTITVYTDASFAKEQTLGVSGFFIRKEKTPDVTEATQPTVQTDVFCEKNNIRAELRGIITALEEVEKQASRGAPIVGETPPPVHLFTDCKSLADLLDRRPRLESNGFTSKRTGRLLNNADLYKVFFEIYDRVCPQITWVKGHSPQKQQAAVHKNFSVVDKFVRETLRDTISRAEPC